jgi:hypothetical protein
VPSERTSGSANSAVARRKPSVGISATWSTSAEEPQGGADEDGHEARPHPVVA